MSRIEKLFAGFIAVLAAHGLSSAGLDPWRGWLAFKEYARTTSEHPDPGMSVQVQVDGERVARLFLLRQSLVTAEDRMNPVGGVVCEFRFAEGPASHSGTAYWSFDYATFERFVDAVEQDPVVATLFVTKPAESRVYWEEA